MSIDNGVYIFSTPDLKGGKEYRVSEASAIENIFWGGRFNRDIHPNLNPIQVCEYFGMSRVYTDEDSAFEYAQELLKSTEEIYGICEYGICSIEGKYPFSEYEYMAQLGINDEKEYDRSAIMFHVFTRKNGVMSYHCSVDDIRLAQIASFDAFLLNEDRPGVEVYVESLGDLSPFVFSIAYSDGEEFSSDDFSSLENAHTKSFKMVLDNPYMDKAIIRACKLRAGFGEPPTKYASIKSEIDDVIDDVEELHTMLSLSKVNYLVRVTQEKLIELKKCSRYGELRWEDMSHDLRLVGRLITAELDNLDLIFNGKIDFPFLWRG